MSDVSSISFQSSDHTIVNSIDSTPANISTTLLFGQLGTALQQVKDYNVTNNSIYIKMAELVKQTQQKLSKLKEQNLQAHRKCLEHIQILLFQQDYREALSKIDQYKKIELTDFQFTISPQQQSSNNILKNRLWTFEQEKSLIENNLVSFELKQQIWLKYAFEDLQDQEQLQHVTFNQIQNAQIQHFRKQFSIKSQITQQLQQKSALVTPRKKNSKSMGILKSQIKKQSMGSNMKPHLKNNKHKSTKLLSPQKKQIDKKTTRKKGKKDGQEIKTSKKYTSIFAA